VHPAGGDYPIGPQSAAVDKAIDLGVTVDFDALGALRAPSWTSASTSRPKAIL
jgi:hypothetical protein